MLLCKSAETREKSDSDMAKSEGGASISMESSPGGDCTLASEVSRASPTKQILVLSSSMTDSDSTSSGTRVERVAAGMLAAALKEVGGGR